MTGERIQDLGYMDSILLMNSFVLVKYKIPSEFCLALLWT